MIDPVIFRYDNANGLIPISGGTPHPFNANIPAHRGAWFVYRWSSFLLVGIVKGPFDIHEGT
jgi:hypothetical protein